MSNKIKLFVVPPHDGSAATDAKRQRVRRAWTKESAKLRAKIDADTRAIMQSEEKRRGDAGGILTDSTIRNSRDWPVTKTLEDVGKLIEKKPSFADTAITFGVDAPMQRELMRRFILSLRTNIGAVATKYKIEPAQQCDDDPFKEFDLIRLWYAHARNLDSGNGNKPKAENGGTITLAEPQNPLYFPCNKAGAVLDTFRQIATLPSLPRPTITTIGNGKVQTIVRDANTGLLFQKVIEDQGWETRNPDFTNATIDPDSAISVVDACRRRFAGLADKITAIKPTMDAAGLNGWTTRCIAVCEQIACSLSGIAPKSKQEIESEWRCAMEERKTTPANRRLPKVTLEQFRDGRYRVVLSILYGIARTPHRLEEFATYVKTLSQFYNELDAVYRQAPTSIPISATEPMTLDETDLAILRAGSREALHLIPLAAKADCDRGTVSDRLNDSLIPAGLMARKGNKPRGAIFTSELGKQRLLNFPIDSPKIPQ